MKVLNVLNALKWTKCVTQIYFSQKHVFGDLVMSLKLRQILLSSAKDICGSIFLMKQVSKCY